MGRPIYPFELGDPDFSWLISNFQEGNPDYTPVEDSSLPVVFIQESLMVPDQAQLPEVAEQGTMLEDEA